MSRALRVVHLPARTPYVRKITSSDFSILNGAITEHGVVPTAVTARWLLDRRPLNWLDVLHLHHLEFDDPATLERLFAACADSHVKVVYTAHDTAPMVSNEHQFQARLELIRAFGASWVGLTDGSILALRDRLPGMPAVTLIPHGYVVSPDDLAGKTRHGTAATPTYLLYGALRASRDHLSTIANWSMGLADSSARLRLLLRALSPAEFDRHDVPALLALIRSDPRIDASMRAYPTDAEVAEAGLNADALLLPYRFGSHSGQLEFAFDLNLLPICSSIGHLAEQYRQHKDLVTEPIWFDWSDGHSGLFGEKFLAALETAQRRLKHSERRAPNNDFLDYRRDEHRRFLDSHAAIYAH